MCVCSFSCWSIYSNILFEHLVIHSLVPGFIFFVYELFVVMFVLSRNSHCVQMFKVHVKYQIPSLCWMCDRKCFKFRVLHPSVFFFSSRLCVCDVRCVLVCVFECVAGGHSLCSLWHWYSALKLYTVSLGWAAVAFIHRHTWGMTFCECRKWSRVQDSVIGAEMMHVNIRSLLTCSGPYSDLGTPQTTHACTRIHTPLHTHSIVTVCFSR